MRPALWALASAGLAAGLAVAMPVWAADEEGGVLSVDPSLQRPSTLTVTMPEMDAARGRVLFATKGCVICHQVNGVGGRPDFKAPSLDAARMPIHPDPFEFAARMWHGAKQMLALQEKDLGYTISLTAEDLADIFAFVHDAEEQKLFRIPGMGPQ